MDGELQQLRGEREAQRQARIDAEQSAAVLKARRDDLADRLAELKIALCPGAGDADSSTGSTVGP